MKLIIILLLFLNLNAATINMKYKGELSLFGRVGNASIEYKNDGKNYRITVVGGGVGILAKLTNNKKFKYESIGSIKNGILIPHKYIGTQTTADSTKIKTYIFDYENSQTVVTREKIEKVTNYKYNIFTFSYDSSSEIVRSAKTKILDELYKDDMVSVFFNKRHRFLEMKKDETKIIQAVGTKDTQEGIVVKLIKKEDGKYIYSIRIEKDYLSDGSENATFILDADNILYETKLAGIMFFGDARIQRLQ